MPLIKDFYNGLKEHAFSKKGISRKTIINPEMPFPPPPDCPKIVLI